MFIEISQTISTIDSCSVSIHRGPRFLPLSYTVFWYWLLNKGHENKAVYEQWFLYVKQGIKVVV